MKPEERKIKAIELLKELDIYEPYIEGFEQENNVCFFGRFGGYWVYQEPEILKKMKEIEEEFNCTVYAITHEYTEFGECYSFMLVTRYKYEWDNLLFKDGSTFYAFSYVWNKTYEDFSEFGTIGVRSFGGGITRVE
jgi:hydroxylamine reductase (hybrid-cluster protein)